MSEEDFFALRPLAVVGVSEDVAKYGRIIYDRLKAAGFEVYPVNPKLDTVAGDKCYPSVSDLPVQPEGVVLVVPPLTTRRIAGELAGLPVRMVWMQPGAELPVAVETLEAAGKTVIHGGPCVLVYLARRKR